MRRLTMAVLAVSLLCSTAATTANSQSSEATPEPPAYPGGDVEFEPVAPSVWRVDEPAWDCGKAYPRQPYFDGAAVAADGRLWFLDRLRGIRELGSCPIVGPKPAFGPRDQALGPDGTLWLLNDDRLWSLDEGGWRVRLEGFNRPGRVGDPVGSHSYSTDCSETSPCYFSVDVAPDGTVWLAGSALTAFDGTDTRHYLSGRGGIIIVGIGPDGTVWARQDGALYAVARADPTTKTTTTGLPSPAPVPTLAGGEHVSILRALDGVTGDVGTWTGGRWLDRLDPVMYQDAEVIRAFEALVDVAGARLDDVTITTALVERTPDNYASVAALRIPAAEMFDLLEPSITAMAPQIERPAASWDRVHDRSVMRVTDLAMPGAYPVTFYPTADSLWVVQADRSLVATILADLPQQIGGPPPALRCDVLQGPFEESFTTGDADRDRAYLTRCVTCVQLLDLASFARVADIEAAMAVLQERCGWPSEPAAPSEAPVAVAPQQAASADPWRVEVPDSGFSMRFPAGWQVELVDQEMDVSSAEVGTAWTALHASNENESMACTVAVGVTDLAPGQWFATGIDGVSVPHWDPDEPGLLWIPTPEIAGVRSFHSTDWGRRAREDPAVVHDVLYALQCVADDGRLKGPDRVFGRLMASFAFLTDTE